MEWVLKHRSRIVSATLKPWQRILVVLLVFAGQSGPAWAQLIWHVSPQGGKVDGQDTITLSDAVQRLNTTPIDKRAAGVIVQLAPGTYRPQAPLHLTLASGGLIKGPVVFQGPEKGRAVISGARVTAGFEAVRDLQALARLPASSRSHVLQTSLTAIGIVNLQPFARQGQRLPLKPASIDVIYRGKPMTLARWPNQGYARIDATPDGPNGTRFSVAGGHAAAWAREPDLQAAGYWFYDWSDESVAIDKVDVGSGLLSIGDGKPEYGMKAGQRVVVENALSELDSPGEWYVDRTAGLLYFWPPAPLNPGDVEVPVLTSVLQVDGAGQVQFKDIDFESVLGDAVVVSDGSNVLIAGAQVRNAGLRGIVMSGQNNKIEGCDISATGEGGVALSGGDRRTLKPGLQFVEGSRIHDFNRRVRTYRPGVQIDGVGNLARSNVIFDAPHSAIIFTGNDHHIGLNEIYDVANETGDVGAIYSGPRDWTERGTVIRDNYLHDIHGPGQNGSRGVYIDDETSGLTVYGNLFVRVDRAVFIGGGRDNVIENNMFVSSSPAIHLDARGLSWQRNEMIAPNSQWRRQLDNSPFQGALYKERYPGLASLGNEGELGRPVGNVARLNIVLDGRPFEFLDNSEYGLSIDRVFTEADARFLKPGSLSSRVSPLDFQLTPDSAALKRGFKPLRLLEMSCVGQTWGEAAPAEAAAQCPAPSARPIAR